MACKDLFDLVITLRSVSLMENMNMEVDDDDDFAFFACKTRALYNFTSPDPLRLTLLSSSAPTEDIEIYRSLQLDESFILAEILPRLPVKSLMRFKCVSKSWLDRISGDPFIETHLNHQQHRDKHPIALGRYQAIPLQQMKLYSYSSDRGLKKTEVDLSHVTDKHGPVEIVGSCNGLVCLLSVLPGESRKPNYLLLWNPATRQVRKLPNPREVFNTRSFGFGFDGASGEYKVVYLTTISIRDTPCLYARVFVKSCTKWRANKGGCGVVGRPDIKAMVEADGALHWLAFHRSSERSIVVSFGLSDEVLRGSNGPGSGNEWCLCNWRGSLAAIKPHEEGGGRYDLRVATWSPERRLSWTILFKLEPRGIERSLLGVLREQLLQLLWLGKPRPSPLPLSGWWLDIEGKAFRYLEGFTHSNYYIDTFISVF